MLLLIERTLLYTHTHMYYDFVHYKVQLSAHDCVITI